MKYKLTILLLLLLCMGGCSMKDNKDFVYTYSFDKVEKQDEERINAWIDENQTELVKTYEIHHENNEKYIQYIYSKKYNDASITRKENSLIVTLKKSNDSNQKAYY